MNEVNPVKKNKNLQLSRDNSYQREVPPLYELQDNAY